MYVFGVLGITPTERNATALDASISWNYTTYLNLAFLALRRPRRPVPAARRCCAC